MVWNRPINAEFCRGFAPSIPLWDNPAREATAVGLGTNSQGVRACSSGSVPNQPADRGYDCVGYTVSLPLFPRVFAKNDDSRVREYDPALASGLPSSVHGNVRAAKAN